MSKRMPANDPILGTWKVNLSKSTYIPGPAPQSATNKFEPWEDGMKGTIEIVDAQGNAIRAETNVKFDGIDYPLKGSPMADTVSVKRPNERETNVVWKKDGKAVMTGKSVISADGKTMTMTQTGPTRRAAPSIMQLPSTSNSGRAQHTLRNTVRRQGTLHRFADQGLRSPRRPVGYVRVIQAFDPTHDEPHVRALVARLKMPEPER